MNHQDRITGLTQRRQFHLEQAAAHQNEAMKCEGGINVLNAIIQEEESPDPKDPPSNIFPLAHAARRGMAKDFSFAIP